MRIPVIAGGVALCAGIIVGAQILTVPKKASAQSEAVSLIQKVNNENEDVAVATREEDVLKDAVESLVESSDMLEIDKTEESERTHVVVKGESLEEIARLYDIEEWTRIYYKNTEIEDPDFLIIGQELVIPRDDEELELRELPQPEVVSEQERVVTASSSGNTSTQAQKSSSASRPRSSSSTGNRYSYGYCTWHVKNLRPDLPNNLGNANTWFVNASAQGFSTGYTPRVGAVAEATTGYMHVAYVTAIHGDGSITVSEMNFKGWGVISSRRVASQQFRYIY